MRCGNVKRWNIIYCLHCPGEYAKQRIQPFLVLMIGTYRDIVV